MHAPCIGKVVIVKHACYVLTLTYTRFSTSCSCNHRRSLKGGMRHLNWLTRRGLCLSRHLPRSNSAALATTACRLTAPGAELPSVLLSPLTAVPAYRFPKNRLLSPLHLLGLASRCIRHCTRSKTVFSVDARKWGIFLWALGKAVRLLFWFALLRPRPA